MNRCHICYATNQSGWCSIPWTGKKEEKLFLILLCNNCYSILSKTGVDKDILSNSDDWWEVRDRLDEIVEKEITTKTVK